MTTAQDQKLSRARARRPRRRLDGRVWHFRPAGGIRSLDGRPGRADRLGHRRNRNADARVRLPDAVATSARSRRGHLRLREGWLRRLSRLCVGRRLLDRLLPGRCCLSRPDQGDAGTVLSDLRRWHDACCDPRRVGLAVGSAHPDPARRQAGGSAEHHRHHRQDRADRPSSSSSSSRDSRPTSSR